MVLSLRLSFCARPFQEVCRLYRASLKLLDSWAIDRTVFLEEATKVRASVRVFVVHVEAGSLQLWPIFPDCEDNIHLRLRPLNFLIVY